MYKHSAAQMLIQAALGNTVLLRVGRANGLSVGQLRILCGVQALRLCGVRVNAGMVAMQCGWKERPGRVLVKELLSAGYIVRGSVGQGRNKRLTLELSASGLGVLGEVERAERAAMRAFMGSV